MWSPGPKSGYTLALLALHACMDWDRRAGDGVPVLSDLLILCEMRLSYLSSR